MNRSPVVPRSAVLPALIALMSPLDFILARAIRRGFLHVGQA